MILGWTSSTIFHLPTKLKKLTCAIVDGNTFKCSILGEISGQFDCQLRNWVSGVLPMYVDFFQHFLPNVHSCILIVMCV